MYLQLKNVLAFSRGDSVNINHSPHDGLIIINKGNEEVEVLLPTNCNLENIKTWGVIALTLLLLIPEKLSPRKAFMLRGGTLNINIPGRSALLLGKTGEPLTYLYL